jgi:hypothetical protein
MAITAPAPENREDLVRQELDYFRNLALSGNPGEYKKWEERANKLSNLLPDEKFYLRFIEKNFDGAHVGRWVVFCEKPPCQLHPGVSKIITVLTIEPTGQPGEFSKPLEHHLEGLRIVLHDWREGRFAAIERLQKMKDDEEKATERDAINDAQGKVDDIFWVWKRAMGELNFRLGADGTGPNRGGKYFGNIFDKNKSNTSLII